ncbi:glutathione S-transferase [Sphingomonas sp. UYAg733]
MLTIWGRPNSHNVKKIAWLAAEIGMPHVRRDVGGQFGMDDAYLTLNPNALIPTIDDDGFVLWESNAILRYLAAKYGPDTYWHDDPAVRAQGDKWMDWQFTFADAQRDAFLNLVRLPVEKRDPARIARSAAACGRHMAVLDEALSAQGWLSGDCFGIGDIPMGVYAHTWFSLPIDRPAVPHVMEWYERLRTRPAFAAQVMIPLT